MHAAVMSNYRLDIIKLMIYCIHEYNLLKYGHNNKIAKGESYNEKFLPERTNCSLTQEE